MRAETLSVYLCPFYVLTPSWASTKRFMRLEEVYGDKLGLAPGDCGVGGGFVLIEIDDTASVHYWDTDIR